MALPTRRITEWTGFLTDIETGLVAGRIAGGSQADVDAIGFHGPRRLGFRAAEY